MSLNERLQRHGKKPEFFFLDNCCSWRTKLTKVFPDILIKLDIFHAIQRVVKKIPKMKGCSETVKLLRRRMIQSLRKVIRDPSDLGEQRTMATPSSEVILKNIDSFLLQWNKIEVNSTQVLPPPALKEISKLRIHVTKGCLSDIPPSGGTNRNEVLHKTLNKSLRRSRIGLELAVALLGFYFYKWNENKVSKMNNKGKRVNYIPPVEIYNDNIHVSEHEEHFGGSLSAQESIEAAAFEFSDNFTDSDEIVNCVNYLLENHSQNDCSEDSSSSDDKSDDSSNDEDCSYFLDSAGISYIIEQASNFAQLNKHLGNIKGEASLSRCYNLIHLKNAQCLLFSKEHKNTANNQRDIDAFLQLNNMQRIEIPGYGNCFFVSLATMIQQNLLNGNLSAEAKSHLQDLGVIKLEDMDIKQMALTLRQVVVNEWLSNTCQYEPF